MEHKVARLEIERFAQRMFVQACTCVYLCTCMCMCIHTFFVVSNSCFLLWHIQYAQFFEIKNNFVNQITIKQVLAVLFPK